jgi:hypothetical protein
MSARTVVSCPRCLRQYAVDSEMDGKLGQCRQCKSTFYISTTRLSTGEPEFSLTDEVTPHWEFFREGCAEMARNASDLLTLAGEPVTREAICEIVESVPFTRDELMDAHWRRGRCSKTLEKAFIPQGTPDDERFGKILGYFTWRIPNSSTDALRMLTAAFEGVLSVEIDQPEPVPVPQPPVRKRGSLANWAERIGF